MFMLFNKMRFSVLKIVLLTFFISIVGLVSAQQKLSVFFDYNDYTLKQNEKENIDFFLNKLNVQKISITKIDILGHCDSLGTEASNEKISQQRAEAVKQYLVSKNISVPVNATGAGKKKPVYSNATETERAKNRRADISFTIKEVKAEYVPVKVVEQPKKPVTVRQKVEAAKIGENVRLQYIHFLPNEDVFLKNSEPALAELLQIMKDFPTLVIEIEGHICCTNDKLNPETGEYNLLSTKRAKAVYNYLIENGIGAERMNYVGYGRTQPITEDRNTVEQMQNRRVEIKILRQ